MTRFEIFCVFSGAESLASLRRFVSDNFECILTLLSVAPLQSANDDCHTASADVLPDQPPQRQDQQQSGWGSWGPGQEFNPLRAFADAGHSSFFTHVSENRCAVVECYSVLWLFCPAFSWVVIQRWGIFGTRNWLWVAGVFILPPTAMTQPPTFPLPPSACRWVLEHFRHKHRLNFLPPF